MRFGTRLINVEAIRLWIQLEVCRPPEDIPLKPGDTGGTQSARSLGPPPQTPRHVQASVSISVSLYRRGCGPVEAAIASASGRHKDSQGSPSPSAYAKGRSRSVTLRRLSPIGLQPIEALQVLQKASPMLVGNWLSQSGTDTSTGCSALMRSSQTMRAIRNTFLALFPIAWRLCGPVLPAVPDRGWFGALPLRANGGTRTFRCPAG